MANERFVHELDAFLVEVRRVCTEKALDIASNILEEITDVNALDTGRCTASWVANAGSPIFYEARDVTPLTRISREQAQERSMATMLNLADYTLGDTIHLANGTEYVSGIEDGVNSLKSIGFVRITAYRYASAGLIGYNLVYGDGG